MREALLVLGLAVSAGCGTSDIERPAIEATPEAPIDAEPEALSEAPPEAPIDAETRARREAHRLHRQIATWLRQLPAVDDPSEADWRRMFDENEFPPDPWGHPYTLRQAQRRWSVGPLGFGLVVHSAGIDGKVGTPDDISRPAVDDPRLFLREKPLTPERMAGSLWRGDTPGAAVLTPPPETDWDVSIEPGTRARREAGRVYWKIIAWINKNGPHEGRATKEHWLRLVKDIELPLDPWGRSYTLRNALPGRWLTTPPMWSHLVVHSAGADGRIGTRDDISRPVVNDPRVFKDKIALRPVLLSAGRR